MTKTSNQHEVLDNPEVAIRCLKAEGDSVSAEARARRNLYVP
jgi:hypothetical protein